MKCIICNKEIEKSVYTNEVLCNSECYKIDFWNSKIKIKDNLNVVRFKGEHYYIENENSTSCFRGFDGHNFKIKFFDGREITTTNLWYNGKIPETHKELLPDNAKFLQ